MSTHTVWTDREGHPIACVEKLKLLRENEAELQRMLQDMFEDALLMGVAPHAMRRHLEEMVASLKELKL